MKLYEKRLHILLELAERQLEEPTVHFNMDGWCDVITEADIKGQIRKKDCGTHLCLGGLLAYSKRIKGLRIVDEDISYNGENRDGFKALEEVLGDC